jgi:hypothetical protein
VRTLAVSATIELNLDPGSGTTLGGSRCEYSMESPRVGHGRDGLQLWRLAANILNKQPWSNDKGWSSSLGVGRGANNPSP